MPHYNSRAIVIVVVNEGNGDFELVGQRNENQQGRRKEDDEEEEQGEEEINKQVQNYKSKLSQGDVFVIPAGHPVAIRASTNLNLLGFGINAENNQRNFLAGISYYISLIHSLYIFILCMYFKNLVLLNQREKIIKIFIFRVIENLKERRTT